MDMSGLAGSNTSAYSFNDLSGLQSISALGRTDKGAALEQVARQFESFFISQMLKGMRAANDIFGSDNPMNTNEMQFRQEMLDQQLSLTLSEGKGLGLADVFGRQLRQQLGADKPKDRPFAAPEMRIDGLRRDTEVARQKPVKMLSQVVNEVLRAVSPVVEKVRDKIEEFADFDSKESFVKAILPHARRAAEALGVDCRALIAQAALETGWGKSIVRDAGGQSSFNLFNIKNGEYWEGPSVGVSTLEFSNGIPQPQRAMFRVYHSFAESFSDYVDVLLTRPRYQRALKGGDGAAGFVRGLQEAGYATDPHYASKVLRVMQDAAIAGAL